MSNRFCAACACSVLALAASAPVSAQSMQGQGQPGTPGQQQAPVGTAGGPRRAWFGNGTGNVGQTLSGGLSLGGGQISRTRIDPLTLDEVVQRSDNWHVSGGLSYSLTGSKANLTANGGASGNLFSGLDNETHLSYRGLVNGGVPLSARTSLSGGIGAYFQPTIVRYFSGILDPDSGQILPPDIDPETLDDTTLTYHAHASLRQAVSAHSNLSLSYGHRRSDYGDDAIQIHDNAGVQYSHAIAAGLGVRAGYHYGTNRSDAPGATRSESHQINAGIDYSKALSISRTTTLSFGTGSAIAKSQGDARFVVTGDASLSQQIGRSWSASVRYGRNVRFLEGVTEVAVVDSVGANLSGNLAQRVAVNASISAHGGGAGLGEDENHFRGFTARAGMSVAASTNVGVSVNYSYYHSNFDNTNYLLSPDLQQYGRHAVATSLGFWGLVAVGVNYSTMERQGIRDHAVMARVSLFAPIYAQARRF